MSTLHVILMAVFALLWLALGYIILDRGGVTLYNILIVLMAGGIIFIPLYKKWKR